MQLVTLGDSICYNKSISYNKGTLISYKGHGRFVLTVLLFDTKVFFQTVGLLVKREIELVTIRVL